MEIAFHLHSVWVLQCDRNGLFNMVCAELRFIQVYHWQIRSQRLFKGSRGLYVRLNSAFKGPMRNS